MFFYHLYLVTLIVTPKTTYFYWLIIILLLILKKIPNISNNFNFNYFIFFFSPKGFLIPLIPSFVSLLVFKRFKSKEIFYILNYIFLLFYFYVIFFLYFLNSFSSLYVVKKISYLKKIIISFLYLFKSVLKVCVTLSNTEILWIMENMMKLTYSIFMSSNNFFIFFLDM